MKSFATILYCLIVVPLVWIVGLGGMLGIILLVAYMAGAI